ncbi:MAG TPA: enoyl-ACP reductase [Verrucomicrobiae bacterium]|nr:enoyl-ACP reductase [Verrucomicrobiae bacterium]
MGLLEGKKAVIFGVANDKSIAWAIAEAFKREGAELALTYAGEALEKRVRPLAEELGVGLVLPCDVTSDEDITAVFDTLGTEWGGLDILVHSVAFADKEELKGSFLNTTRKGFALAMDISAYSLIGLMKAAHPLMAGRDASAIALTYYGAQKVFPNYNAMGVAKAALEASVRYLAVAVGGDGIRVNAISAGPIKTLAAAGIGGFKEIGRHVEERAPLKRNVTQEDVAGSALYLCSGLSHGVTGETHFVDCGYNIVGM